MGLATPGVVAEVGELALEPPTSPIVVVGVTGSRGVFWFEGFRGGVSLCGGKSGCRLGGKCDCGLGGWDGG